MANEKQITYWNEVAGPKWVNLGDAMEARLDAINRLLLTTLQIDPGETVLDIGCGTGITSKPLAEAAGPAGHVTGIDISVPMLEVAASRCAGIPNVKFLQADAQIYDFGAATFDVLTSRFGVMFFADSVAAFTNLRTTLTPSGRLCFICWAGLADNIHWKIPFDLAVAELGPPEPRPPHAPGPMALSDTAYLRNILHSAGFTNISITPTAVPILGENVEEEARIACLMGPAGALLDEKQANETMRDHLIHTVAEAIRPFATPNGMQLPATVLVVKATGH